MKLSDWIEIKKAACMKDYQTYTDALKELHKKGDSEGVKRIDIKILETKAFQDALLALENDVKNGIIHSI